MAFRGRGGEPAAERHVFEGAKHRLRRLRGPGINLGPRRVAKREPQPRHIHRHRYRAHDHALDNQHRDAVMNLVADFQIGEGQSPEVHWQPDGTIERCELRRMSHDILAPAEQRRAESYQRNDRERQRNAKAIAQAASVRPSPAGGHTLDVRGAGVVQRRDVGYRCVTLQRRRQGRRVLDRNGDVGKPDRRRSGRHIGRRVRRLFRCVGADEIVQRWLGRCLYRSIQSPIALVLGVLPTSASRNAATVSSGASGSADPP